MLIVHSSEAVRRHLLAPPTEKTSRPLPLMLRIADEDQQRDSPSRMRFTIGISECPFQYTDRSRELWKNIHGLTIYKAGQNFKLEAQQLASPQPSCFNPEPSTGCPSLRQLHSLGLCKGLQWTGSAQFMLSITPIENYC